MLGVKYFHPSHSDFQPFAWKENQRKKKNQNQGGRLCLRSVGVLSLVFHPAFAQNVQALHSTAPVSLCHFFWRRTEALEFYVLPWRVVTPVNLPSRYLTSNALKLWITQFCLKTWSIKLKSVLKGSSNIFGSILAQTFPSCAISCQITQTWECSEVKQHQRDGSNMRRGKYLKFAFEDLFFLLAEAMFEISR